MSVPIRFMRVPVWQWQRWALDKILRFSVSLHHVLHDDRTHTRDIELWKPREQTQWDRSRFLSLRSARSPISTLALRSAARSSSGISRGALGSFLWRPSRKARARDCRHFCFDFLVPLPVVVAATGSRLAWNPVEILPTKAAPTVCMAGEGTEDRERTMAVNSST